MFVGALTWLLVEFSPSFRVAPRENSSTSLEPGLANFIHAASTQSSIVVCTLDIISNIFIMHNAPFIIIILSQR